MSADSVAMLFSFTFVFILIIGFLIGMWRGIRRSGLNLAYSLIGAVIAFFCCGAITNAIMGIQITVNGTANTINGYFVSLLMNNPDLATLINATPSFESFILQVPTAIANVLVFIALSIAFQFVFYILYTIFAAIFIRKRDKEGNVKPQHRLAGGCVGLVKVFILSLFIMMPLTALVGTSQELVYGSEITVSADSTVDDGTANEQPAMNTTGANGILGKLIPKEANSILSGYEKSAFGFLGNVFGLDNAMFDYLAAIHVNDQNIQLRKEVSQLNELYTLFSQFTDMRNSQSEIKFADINFKHLDKTIDSILDSGFYQTVVADLAGTIIVEYDKLSFIDPASLGDFAPVLEDISSVLSNGTVKVSDYIGNDLKAIYQACKNMVTNGFVDDYFAQADKSPQKLLEMISSEAYVYGFKTSLGNVFSMNILRDSTATIVNLGLSQLFTDLDKVVVNGRTLTEDDWANMVASVTDVIQEFSSLSKQVELDVLIKDPLQLLAKDATQDISTVMISMGKMIDRFRAIPIFQNAAGESVMDSVITNAGFALPTLPIINANGESLTISNYEQLLTFIATPLEALKQLNVYDLLKQETISTVDVLTAFASGLETDATILEQIILPLYQVEPTKTLLFTNMLEKLPGDVINFATLNSYDAWKQDIGYISNLLTILNKGNVGGKTYLEVALEGNVETLLKNLGDDLQITDLLKPILYAKATANLQTNMMNTFATVLNELVGNGTIQLDLANITLQENALEDQVNEICAVFEKFMAFYTSYQTGSTTISTLDKIQLGRFLDVLKLNAYRTTLDAKTETGLFKDSFDAIIIAIQAAYPGVDFGSDFAHTDFTEIFTNLQNAGA